MSAEAAHFGAPEPLADGLIDDNEGAAGVLEPLEVGLADDAVGDEPRGTDAALGAGAAVLLADPPPLFDAAQAARATAAAAMAAARSSADRAVPRLTDTLIRSMWGRG